MPVCPMITPVPLDEVGGSLKVELLEESLEL